MLITQLNDESFGTLDFEKLFLKAFKHSSRYDYKYYPNVKLENIAHYYASSIKANLNSPEKKHWFYEAEENSILLESHRSQFDSEHFDVPFVWLKVVLGPSQLGYKKFYQKLIERILIEENFRKPLLLIARVDSSNIGAIQALQATAFHVYEGNTYTVKKIDKKLQEDPLSSSAHFRFATKADLEIVAHIAKDNNFQGSHLHLSPYLSKEKVDEMYVKWIKNIFANESSHLVVMEVNRKIAGFYTFTFDQKLNQALDVKLARTGIIGLCKSFSGKGLGHQLMSGGISLAQSLGAEIIDSSYSVNNVKSAIIHSKAGFYPVNHSITLHRWQE